MGNVNFQTRDIFIKNAHENLLFATLPSNHTELKEFLIRLICISKLESKKVINDYDGFDFESLKLESMETYNENVSFLKKYKERLETAETIENRLVKLDYKIDLIEFCSIYNSLYPCFLRVFNSYIGFDFESYKDSDAEVYNENMIYLDRYMKRGGEIYSLAMKNDINYKNDITLINKYDEYNWGPTNENELSKRKLAHILDSNLFIANAIDDQIITVNSLISDLFENQELDDTSIKIIEKHIEKNISLFVEFRKYLNNIKFELDRIKRHNPDDYAVILVDVLALSFFGAEWWIEKFEELKKSEIDNHELFAQYKNGFI